MTESHKKDTSKGAGSKVKATKPTLTVGEAIIANPIVGRYVGFTRTLLKVAKEVDSTSGDERRKKESHLLELAMGFYRQEVTNDSWNDKSGGSKKPSAPSQPKGGPEGGNQPETKVVEAIAKKLLSLAPLKSRIGDILIRTSADGAAVYQHADPKSDSTHKKLEQEELRAVAGKLSKKSRKVLDMATQNAQAENDLGLGRTDVVHNQLVQNTKKAFPERTDPAEVLKGYIASEQKKFDGTPLEGRVSTHDIKNKLFLEFHGKDLTEEQAVATIKMHEEISNLVSVNELDSKLKEKFVAESNIAKDLVLAALEVPRYRAMKILGSISPIQLAMRVISFAKKVTGDAHSKLMGIASGFIMKLGEQVFIKQPMRLDPVPAVLSITPAVIDDRPPPKEIEKRGTEKQPHPSLLLLKKKKEKKETANRAGPSTA